jgi:hypothetical protein
MWSFAVRKSPLTFRRMVLPPSLVSNNKLSEKSLRSILQEDNTLHIVTCTGFAGRIIIRGSHLMTGFIRTSLQLQGIITAHNQWLLTTRSIPDWTMSVFSSTVTNEESLLTESLGSLTNELRLFYNIRATRIQMTTSNSSCYSVFSLQRERSHQAVAQQWTSALALLFRLSDGAYRSVA